MRNSELGIQNFSYFSNSELRIPNSELFLNRTVME